VVAHQIGTPAALQQQQQQQHSVTLAAQETMTDAYGLLAATNDVLKVGLYIQAGKLLTKQDVCNDAADHEETFGPWGLAAVWHCCCCLQRADLLGQYCSQL
jgi:hypothetical protein